MQVYPTPRILRTPDLSQPQTAFPTYAPTPPEQVGLTVLQGVLQGLWPPKHSYDAPSCICALVGAAGVQGMRPGAPIQVASCTIAAEADFFAVVFLSTHIVFHQQA
jgi:hypothetical protein